MEQSKIIEELRLILKRSKTIDGIIGKEMDYALMAGTLSAGIECLIIKLKSEECQHG